MRNAAKAFRETLRNAAKAFRETLTFVMARTVAVAVLAIAVVGSVGAVDPVAGTTAPYPFRHGSTTISLWAAPSRAPRNPSLAGIQYVVNDVDAVNAIAESRHVPVEQPLRESLPGLRTVWLQDPDGVTNYFAQILPRTTRQ